MPFSTVERCTLSILAASTTMRAGPEVATVQGQLSAQKKCADQRKAAPELRIFAVQGLLEFVSYRRLDGHEPMRQRSPLPGPITGQVMLTSLVSESALVQARLSTDKSASMTPIAILPNCAARGAASNGGIAPPSTPARLYPSPAPV